ncbi:MAG: ABC transporter substrate-binding protein [Puniceicoccales bacterium]|jgi:putative ABC transport system substrate-binding protein|nr:ABC transporter substrate-binding protein [Puniceicoccales bacterium]
MKVVKILLPLAALCTAFVLVSAFAESVPNEKVILINKFVDHPALDETARGIIDALADAGFAEGKTATVRVESAQASAALASQISNKFANQSPDVVICIGTVSAQSMAKYANAGTAKVIFSSITDPVGAGLVKNLDETGGNISGVSNFVSLEPQLELMKKFQPRLKKLGIIYNAGEMNSLSIVEKLNAVAGQFGLKIVTQAVIKTSDVPQAATRLASTVDAIFISNDNTALSCLPSIVHVCNSVGIPVYVSDTDAIGLGALAALGPNQYAVGRQTGEMAAKVLNGASIATLPVEFPTTMELVVNAAAARFLRIIIPQSVFSSATRILP